MSISLSSVAMIATVNISVWTARKLDRKVSEDVDVANSTLTKAGRYHKNLLAGDESLTNISKIVSEVRTYHIHMTSPWNDTGGRLLTTAQFLEYCAGMGKLEKMYWDSVNAFLPQYDVKIEAAAFQLGALFNREEYPTVDNIARKFAFNVGYTPLPESGDFRVDVTNEAVDELRQQYEITYAANIAKVQDDAWQRLYKILSQLSSSLRIEEDGTKGRLHKSVFDSASELCSLLSAFNVSGDTQLEHLRQRLEDQIVGIEIEDIKQSDFMRAQLKTEVDDMLGKWN
jgi:hypothetical protein